jgi:uncharacterized protein YecA (UPF0149 family)
MKGAEEYFLRGREMSAASHDRLGALERLIDLSIKTGDTVKKEQYEKEYHARLEPTESPQVEPERAHRPVASGGSVVKGRKIGRNEPCPCGSGKKYKKCCGR